MQTLLAVTVVLGCDGATARETWVLNNPTAPPLTNEASTGFLDRVAREAFRRIDVDIQLVRLPAERGLRNANAGIDDGDLTRIAGLERHYPNLVRVPEKIMDFEFTAFSRHHTIRTDRWSALRPYRVGIIKGWKIYEENLRGVVTPVYVDNAEQLFNLLKRDRVDVVLYSRWMGEAQLRERGLLDAAALKPPLASVEMFTYLHKRHAARIPQLAAALREMKADGTYRRFLVETIGPYSRH
ncbi:MAG TPA: transporter substrate-binding domain-containing protein [Burkholderiales bacterium]|nr:transporter substrate-binding domain-containing protein [Burkholderiales bacterium]